MCFLELRKNKNVQRKLNWNQFEMVPRVLLLEGKKEGVIEIPSGSRIEGGHL